MDHVNKVASDFAQLFPLIDKRRETQNEIQKHLLKLKKTCFTMNLVEHWLRFPREVMESPVSKIFKTDWTLP